MSRVVVLVVLAVAVLAPGRAAAQVIAEDRFCDPAYENCRAPLLALIEAETVGIDVGFWFMQDARYAHALIRKWSQGVPVRVIFDSQAFNDFEYPGAQIPVAMMADPPAAGYTGVPGIPLRDKTGGSGIFHYKMMLFAGQGVVEFSGANYSDEAFVYREPFANYVDEVIMFSNTASIVNSFKTKFDDAWTDTTMFSNYANVTTLQRNYETHEIDPQLQFGPSSNFASWSVVGYRGETLGIDAIMYRVTDQRHSNEMIAAAQRGVPVRFIGEPLQYRSEKYYWVSWNLDRMYAAGVQMRMRGHEGLSHEKLTLLRGQSVYVFGSSNWTSASATSQHEHNIFGSNPTLLTWAQDHFDRKWNNTGPVPETVPFVPLPPDNPVYRAPANGAQNVPTGVDVPLRWDAGPFAHNYDVFLGTSPSSLTKILDNVNLGPSPTNASGHNRIVTIPAGSLQSATTYYWQVVSRTMAGVTATGPVWSFRTEGGAPPTASGEIVMWASSASRQGSWVVTADTSAAGGAKLRNPNASAAKLSAPLASPEHYFERTFTAAAGVPYRLWLRGRADSNSWANDSVYVQFSDSVASVTDSTAIWRIGTTSATTVTIEDCANCGLSAWGWNDNATGAGALGPTVVFAASGEHTIRVQVREDGLSIDQIILAPEGSGHFTTAPGETKNDGNIYPEQGGTTGSGGTGGTGGTGGSGGTSCEASSLPSGWERADIGSVGALGNSCFDEATQTFTLNGSGADIWGTADEFQFVYRPLTGDGAIVAHVAAVSNTDAWTKSGVMMREALTAGSKHAMMIVSAGKGLAFQRRVATSGVSTHTSGGAGEAPSWVKLERAGNVFTASRSTDGTAWTVVGTETIEMGPTIFVGLPLTSHRDGTVATATVTGVSVTP